jgi:predicted MPP superfamily phosphohydrolase
MLLPTSLYNLAMAVVVAASLAWLHRRRTVASWAVLTTAAAFMAVFLAAALARDPFAMARLCAFGVFLHAPPLLAGTGVLFRRVRPRVAIALVAAAAILVLVAVDAFLIEPHWLAVSHVELFSPKIERPVRIVVLADLQTDEFGPYERDILRRVVEEQPDMILLAGDYLQAAEPRREELCREMNAYLREIGFAAPGGIYAVDGNVDSGPWWRLFQSLDVKTVRSTASFAAAGIRLTCLSVGDSFSTRLRIPPGGDGRFHVVLGHSPDYALGSAEADLLVAGHTHGGQVCLPLVGPLVTMCKLPRGLASGVHALPSGATLLVSRGVGMERGTAPRMRFWCRPEVVVVDLLPE